MMDSADLELMRQATRDAIATAGEHANASVVDKVLGELGWRELLDDDARTAIAVVFGALGTANANSTALDDAVLHSLGQPTSAEIAVTFPSYASWECPGVIDGTVLQVRGIATERVANATSLFVVCRDQEVSVGVRVPIALADVRVISGIDPSLRLHAISIAREMDGLERVSLEAASWDAAVAVARRAISEQISGALRTMLQLARTHALEREQFNRVVARFQAVRHRLAEALVAIEALDATILSAADEATPLTAALAKATAGRGVCTVSAHCQQVLAGIGFTTDHSFHRYLKRVMALEGLFGSTDAITAEIGRTLLRERRVPTLIDL